MAQGVELINEPFGVWGRQRAKQNRAPANLLAKEGFLFKKGGIIKSWSRRYCVLNKQSLCYFKHEFDASTQETEGGGGLAPLGRIFLSDVVNIQSEGVEKKKAFVFALHTRKRAVLFQAANTEDKEKWVEAIKVTLESDKEAERKDPFRRTLRKLSPGLKRVTLVKDPEKGIGCTIKNAAGHILVHRIIEDGPIALTGVLRPGDEVLDIHGSAVTGLSVSEVVAIIRAAPDEFLATVKPFTALKKGHKADTTPIIYCTIQPQAATPTSSGDHTHQLENPALTSSSGSSGGGAETSSNGSLDDVGNYDDEDEGDAAPPLPPRTEDALILVDPPPLTAPPRLPPKPLGIHELLDLQHSHNKSVHHLSAASSHRPRMVKARSLEDTVERGEGEGVRPHTGRPRRPHLYEDIDLEPGPAHKQQRGRRPLPNHTYEEIKPQLIYAELSHHMAAK